MRQERRLYQPEKDYRSAMDGPCRLWREAHVVDGYTESADGTRLHYYYAIPEGASTCIVILHGLCEFFGKYHEMVWTFYKAGYAVFFPEHRGHGKSGGKLPEPDADVVYIDTYHTYVDDVHAFIKNIVDPHTNGMRRILFGHSMGGAIATLYLEEHPDAFQSAILSSPMFRMKAAHYPRPIVSVLRAYVALTRKSRQLAFGEQHFSPEPVFEGSSAKSKARYDYFFEQRVHDRAYQTYGASFGWVMASMVAVYELMDHANRIRIPVALMTAGEDRLVDAEGYTIFQRKVPQTKRYDYPKSGHEIFNADEETGERYYQDMFAFLKTRNKE